MYIAFQYLEKMSIDWLWQYPSFRNITLKLLAVMIYAELKQWKRMTHDLTMMRLFQQERWSLSSGL